MNYRAVTTLALRLTGVAVLVEILPSTSATIVALILRHSTSAREALVLAAFSAVIPLLVGLALIWFPERLSSVMVGSAPVVEDDTNADRLGEVAMIVVGVYLFATGIFD